MTPKNPDFATYEISEQALNMAAKKKKTSGKTMFNLPEEAFEYLKLVAQTPPKFNAREFMELAANIAKNASECGAFALHTEMENKIKRSVSISKKDQEVFEELAKKYNTSRDCIVYSAIKYTMEMLRKSIMSAEEKITCAKALLEILGKMSDLWDSKEAKDSLQKLINSDDPDLAGADPSLEDFSGYIGQIFEMYGLLEEFIELKEKQIKQN